MTDLRGFTMTIDTPSEKLWEWNGYSIQWQPLPDDGSWDEDWEYLLNYHGLQSGRAGGCGFSTLDAAIDYAIQDDKDCRHLETFGSIKRYYDAALGAWVEVQI